jgi:hypothetical protein
LLKKRFIFTCAVVYFLGGCISEPSTFIINDPENLASSVELQHCGKNMDFSTAETGFVYLHRAPCSEHGKIVADLEGGDKVTCGVGYITPDVGMVYSYEIRNQKCVNLSVRLIDE